MTGTGARPAKASAMRLVREPCHGPTIVPQREAQATQSVSLWLVGGASLCGVIDLGALQLIAPQREAQAIGQQCCGGCLRLASDDLTEGGPG